ncbi:42904_t:CDS:1, partial [Gigaspora margarita]
MVRGSPKKILLSLEDPLVFRKGKDKGVSRSEYKSVIVVKDEDLVGIRKNDKEKQKSRDNKDEDKDGANDKKKNLRYQKKKDNKKKK